MKCPSIPETESERLRALSAYGLGDNRPLPSLDAVVRIAARMFDMPVAIVNMIGNNSVKFLATMKDHGGFDESLITNDFLWWSTGQGAMDKATMKSLVANMAAIMPRMPEMTIVDTTAEGDRVAVEVTGKCQLANGKHYDNTYHFLLEFENGRIRKVKEYCDTKLASDAFA